MDEIQKIEQQEIMVELFSILHDLKSFKILAKDFDNKLGVIRSKLNNVKYHLHRIENITESIDEREAKIENTLCNNNKKIDFLNDFKEKVEGRI